MPVIIPLIPSVIIYSLQTSVLFCYFSNNFLLVRNFSEDFSEIILTLKYQPIINQYNIYCIVVTWIKLSMIAEKITKTVNTDFPAVASVLIVFSVWPASKYIQVCCRIMSTLCTGCVHLSCSAYVNSAFYPTWDGKWVSAFGLSNNNKWRWWL